MKFIIFMILMCVIACESNDEVSLTKNPKIIIRILPDGQGVYKNSVLSEHGWKELLRYQISKNKNGRLGAYLFDLDQSLNTSEVYKNIIMICECGLPEWEFRVANEIGLFAAVDNQKFERLNLISHNDYLSILPAHAGRFSFRGQNMDEILIGKVSVETFNSSGLSTGLQKIKQLGGAEIIFAFVDGNLPAKDLIELSQNVVELTGRPPILVLKGKEAEVGFRPAK